MKLFRFVLFVALVAITSHVATAASAYMVGGGQVSAPVGTLQIIIDIAPELLPMEVGGVELGVFSTNPGFLRFTGARVHNPVLGTDLNGNAIKRWEVAIAAQMSDERINLFRGSSIYSPGLSTAFADNPVAPGSTEFLFATIEYEILHSSGSTQIDLYPTYDYGAFVDKGNFPVGTLTGTTISIAGTTVSNPEPSTMVMTGLSLIGLAFRRRNG